MSDYTFTARHPTSTQPRESYLLGYIIFVYELWTAVVAVQKLDLRDAFRTRPCAHNDKTISQELTI